MNTLLSKFVIPFDESEIEVKINKFIYPQSLITKHEQAIAILDAIEHLHSMIKLKKYSISGFSGTFTELRKKYVHNIEIYTMCINRLQQRYDKLFN
jgi:hydroxypyruvate isomerase